jgi:hypothetical protein
MIIYQVNENFISVIINNLFIGIYVNGWVKSLLLVGKPVNPFKKSWHIIIPTRKRMRQNSRVNNYKFRILFGFRGLPGQELISCEDEPNSLPRCKILINVVFLFEFDYSYLKNSPCFIFWISLTNLAKNSPCFMVS